MEEQMWGNGINTYHPQINYIFWEYFADGEMKNMTDGPN